MPNASRLCWGLILFTATSAVWADDADIEFFERKIRPILVTHCYECHSADSKKLGGQLLLDSRDGILKGGESGAVISAGHPEGSLLIKAIRYDDDSVRMPPKGKMPETAIHDLEEWVKRGAVDPRDKSTVKKDSLPWPDVMRERSDWWSLKPIGKSEVPFPPDQSWSGHPVDRFIGAKLRERGLSPAELADPRTLARRLSLVLTGLPPTTEQVDQFVAKCRSGRADDPLPKAVVEEYVDTLLQSPHFGERWARHWMDIVRFSETHGNEWNYEVHHAWRYRDYLIRAFNDDVPYDQFVREHIAGDLLPNPRWNQKEQFNESVIGTGFYRFGEVNHDDCITLRAIGYDLADNQIDTLTKAFQATTVACARCHNHKLDAISTEDYYAMLAILRSSRNVSHCIDAKTVNQTERSQLKSLKKELHGVLASMWADDLKDIERYILAAHAKRTGAANADQLATGLTPERLAKWIEVLSVDKEQLEDPFDLLRRLTKAEVPAKGDVPANALAPSKSYAQVWTEWSQSFAKESSDRIDFNRTQMTPYADFRDEHVPNWQFGGQSMSESLPSKNGEFLIQTDGDSIVHSVVPAGRYTNAISAKMNGTLRSHVLPAGKKFISFQVIGQRSSAVRLVSNNCQLNYANYRALTSPDLHWITFTIPEDREILQTYAELMTMFDNPKFPDQLSALGGDRDNYKLPWDKAAENPRSYFGVTRVVLHDSNEGPKAELGHLQCLTAAEEKVAPTISEVVKRYVARIDSAINSWANDSANEEDVYWLNAMVRADLLSNRLSQSKKAESIMKDYRRIESSMSVPRVVAGMSDGGPGIAQPVFMRGDYNRPGESVPRRYLEVLSMVQPAETIPIAFTTETSKPTLKPFTSKGSGRLELAERIASPTNPLTARVMVNRIWHHLFGAGLVRTVDDFGHVGERPSHPELLDHLANQFVNDGWSVKRMIRSLVMTHTFQASNRASLEAREIDPQNRLLQHYSARRMEAEAVRDSIMSASGRLDLTLYGYSIQPYREKEYADRRLFPGPLDGNGRRSIYIKNNLMESPKFLGVFNFPGGKVTQGRRDVTNVPAQALALMNDPFVLQQAEVWSQKVIKQSGDSIATRLDSMFLSSLNRSPNAEEQHRFEQAIRELAELHQVPAEGVMTSVAIWKDVAHAIMNMNELIYIP